MRVSICPVNEETYRLLSKSFYHEFTEVPMVGDSIVFDGHAFQVKERFWYPEDNHIGYVELNVKVVK